MIKTLLASITVITAIVFVLSPVHLQGADAEVMNTEIVNADKEPNLTPILLPDYCNLAISYSRSERHDYVRKTMIGELLEVVGAPVFRIEGPTQFDDGTIASQVVVCEFVGLWEFQASSVWYDEFMAVGSGNFSKSAILTFGLTEDGLTWRVIDGRFPLVSCGPDSGLHVADDRDFGVCINVGGYGEPVPPVNDLSYIYRNVNDFSVCYGSQSLSTSERVSDYPVFSFYADYTAGELLHGADEANYVQGRTVIALESGPNQPPTGE